MSNKKEIAITLLVTTIFILLAESIGYINTLIIFYILVLLFVIRLWFLLFKEFRSIINRVIKRYMNTIKVERGLDKNKYTVMVKGAIKTAKILKVHSIIVVYLSWIFILLKILKVLSDG